MKRNPIITAAMVAVCSILSAQAGTKKATICTTYGDDIYDYELDQMIDSVVPPSAKRLIVLTQCYGGDCLDNFTGTNTSVISATSPGQKAIYGGYDDDAANACKPGAGKTGQAVHDAGSAGKDSTETPSTGGGLAPGAVSLEPVTADGAVRSRHVIVYAGMPDEKGRDNAQRNKIKTNFAGQPNTTVKTVGGEGPADGWDKHGWKRGLQEAINEAAAAIEAAPDPSKEQFLLFVTDHGDLHNVEHVTTPAPPSNSVVVANVAAFAAADFAERQFERPGFSFTVDIAPFTHAVGDDPAAYTPFFPTNAWRLLLTPPPPAAPILLTGFEERFIEADDGIIGNAPEEGVRLFFPVAPEGFVDSFFDVTYDAEIFNDTAEPYLIMDFSQDTGPVAKGESEPGFFRITENLWIGENDMVFDGHDVVVDGCTVTVDGVHVFDRLALENGATVTHSAGSMGLALTVLNDVTVPSGSKIDVTAKGGWPLASASGRCGGSYGGRGGLFSTGVSAPVYGDVFWPVDLGSGGLSDKAAATRGGGRIQITAGSLVLQGQLIADGQTVDTDWRSAGSGGAILLDVGTLSGSGSITANGGNAATYGSYTGAKGGGGRVAVYYETVDGFNLNSLQAAGQTGAGAGTIYIENRTTGWRSLKLDNLGRVPEATIPTPVSVTANRLDSLKVVNRAQLSLGLDGSVYLDETLVLDAGVAAVGGIAGPDLVMTNGNWTQSGIFGYTNTVMLAGASVLSHGAGEPDGLRITARAVTVASGAVIDATAKGLWPLAAASGRAGGSYGGRGGLFSTSVSAPVYGDVFWPVDLGSGGRSDRAVPSTRGGGRIQIEAASLVLAGGLKADGESSATDYVSAGSGGTILLDVKTLSGSGTITANGGNAVTYGSYSGAKGGGGRVAVYFDALDGFNPNGIQAAGQTGAGAGTVYVENRTTGWRSLTLNNLGRVPDATLPTPVQVGEGLITDLTVLREARLSLTLEGTVDLAAVSVSNAYLTCSGELRSAAVTLAGSSVLNHPAGDANGVRLTAGTVTVASGSAIDVTAKGAWPLSSSSGRVGGSYGGLGEVYGTGVPSPVYGDAYWPTDLGSGGRSDKAASTRGGGRIQIIADRLELNGQLLANGQNGSGDWTSGGSGGSVLVDVGTLTGSGAINAAGGAPGAPSQSWGGGDGGGGRVAVYAQARESFTPAAAGAKAGDGAQWGTVFLGLPRAVTVTVTGQGACDPAGLVVIPYGETNTFVFSHTPQSLATNGTAVTPAATVAWANRGLWRGTQSDAAWLAALNAGGTLVAGFEALAAGQASVPPGGGLAVTVNGLAGWRYTLERRESLTEGEWQPVPGQVEIVCPASGPLLLADAAALPQAFYRVVSEP